MNPDDKVIQIFPAPGLLTRYSGTIEEEFNYIQNLEYVPNGVSTAADGWPHQTKDTHLLRHKELFKIKDFIDESLNKFTNEIWKTKQTLIVTQSWCNKNLPGEEHAVHNHPNSIISGVFYFKQNENLPPLQFVQMINCFYLPDIEEFNAFNSRMFSIPMNDGELILFPSTLWHQVAKNRGRETRYSMSFNTFSNELGTTEGLTELKVQVQENQ